jgi:hypothetical protein
MPKFTLTCEHTSLWSNEQICKNTHEFEVEPLDKVLENFELFLRGAGYIFDGVVDIVPTEEDYPEYADHNIDEYNKDPDEIVPTINETEHSEYYWNTERNKPAADPNWPFAAPSPKTFGPHPQATDEWTQVIRGEGT